MIQLSGIFSESLGGTCTIRGYAKYNEIVELSYPHPGYQRPAEDEHVAEISSFITSGSNSFSPEVVLAYTAKYNYYAQGASSEVDALADIRSGKGFTSNVDGIIECKVLQPIGSVFEHSNQQKRFFTKEKFDEKFQKRIDYFSKVAMSFFANHGYDTEGFTINPYMVVNKVFSSYYKHVQFPIVTFDELKREIQL